MMRCMKTRNAFFLLLLTSFIWGTAFVAQSTAANNIGPFTYNAIRMLIGALVLLPFSYKSLRKNLRIEGYAKKLLVRGAICGTFLGLASHLQQHGIHLHLLWLRKALNLHRNRKLLLNFIQNIQPPASSLSL